MVKPPKIRHSKTRTDPVTIDLDAKDVKREASASAASASPTGTQAPASPIQDQGPVKEPDKPAASASGTTSAASAAASSMKPETSASGKSTSAPHGSPGAAGGSSASSFGRQSTANRPEQGASDTKPKEPAPGSSAKPSTPQPNPAKPRGGISALAAGVIGGVIAFALAAGLQAAGVLPFGNGQALVQQPAETVPSQADLDSLRAEIAQLREQAALPGEGEAGAGAQAMADLATRIDALSQSVDELRAARQASGSGSDSESLASMEGRLVSLEGGLNALTQSVDPAQTEALVQKVDAIAQQMESRGQTTSETESAVQAITGRIDALEQSLAALNETVSDQPRMALAIAATALKAAIDRGAPFTAELDSYAAVSSDAQAPEPLRAAAANGIATSARIEGEMNNAAVAMIDAARPVDPDAGLVDRLMTSAQSLISVRPIGSVEGEGVPATVARMEAAVKAGDYDAALAEYDRLPETAKAAGAKIAADIRARKEADAALATIMARALQPASSEPTAPPASGD